jgi:hypothetical protein
MGLGGVEPRSGRIPIIDVTDLYHPFQDPGDNLDLVHAFAFPQVELRAVILDVTDSFRRPLANAPHMWHDPNGPREPGIVPVTQLNYLFDRQVPYAVGPFHAMRTAEDKLLDIPDFQQAGIRLLLETLEAAEQPIEVLSFGSTRTIAAAFNRNPALVRRKVARIHISAGTATTNFELGPLQDQNEMPGGEWNVALDRWAFIRLLQSDLPIALYPCATKNGAFSYGSNNTYWNFIDLSFIARLDAGLRNYVIYALARMNRPDFLACLDGALSAEPAEDRLTHPHHVWETAIWLNVTRQKLAMGDTGEFSVVPLSTNSPGSQTIRNSLVPCEIKIRSDGRFSFQATSRRSNFSIFQRDDPAEYQLASRQAFTALWTSFKLPRLTKSEAPES